MTPAHAFWSFAPLNTGAVRGVRVTDNIRGMRTRRSAIVVVALAVVVGVAAAFGAWHSDRGESAGTAVGRAAPGFSGPIARQTGGTFSLSGERGHAVLLSFLNTQAQA